jgi:hypothetical protein
MAEIKTEDGKKEKYYLYYDGETVSGKVLFFVYFNYLFVFFYIVYVEILFEVQLISISLVYFCSIPIITRFKSSFH